MNFTTRTSVYLVSLALFTGCSQLGAESMTGKAGPAASSTYQSPNATLASDQTNPAQSATENADSLPGKDSTTTSPAQSSSSTSPAQSSSSTADNTPTPATLNPLPPVPEKKDGVFSGKLGANDLAGMHQCLTNWGINPFVGFIHPDRVIYASVSALSFGPTISDTDVSSGPELILIIASVNLVGMPVWNLLNPNGWYCVIAGVDAGVDLTVNLKKGAHISEGKANINILSDATPIANFGVDLLTYAHVEEVE